MEDLKNQDDLEKFLGVVLRPLDAQSLETMLRACHRLVSLQKVNDSDIKELMEIIKTLEDRDDRNLIRRKSIMILAKIGAWDEALLMTRQMELLVERLDALLSLATKCFEANSQQDGFSALIQIETLLDDASTQDIWQWQKIALFDETAKKWFQESHKQKALELWDKAIKIAQTRTTGEDENIALQNMVGNLASVGYLDLAEKAARMISHTTRREIGLKIISEARKKE